MNALRVTTHVPQVSIGKPGSPIGTREWADYLRLGMISDVDHIGEQDKDFASTIQFARKHRAWTLMNRPDGKFFESLEQFCAERRPFGLGMQWSELAPFVRAGLTKRGISEDTFDAYAREELGMPAPTAVERVRHLAGSLSDDEWEVVVAEQSKLRSAGTR